MPILSTSRASTATPTMSVWAPRAKSVKVHLVELGTLLSMKSAGGGYYELATANLPLGAAYQLLLDNDEQSIPDPRADEVDSVLGPCRRVDHAAFSWTDAGFVPTALRDAIIYELHVGTFTERGTFEGAAERLPQLRELGITHVELMPVATFSGERNWGYDGSALFAPHPQYGGSMGLKRFVDRAHALGIAVVLDVVYNHLGPVGNFLHRFGPYFHDARSTAWGQSLNFDGPDSGPVRRFFIDNAIHWLRDYHCDGLRLDAVHAIEDRTALPFLEELATEVEQLSSASGKPLMLIAESDLNDPRLLHARGEPHLGYGLDAQWSDDFHHALHVMLTGESRGYYVDYAQQPLANLAHVLQHGWLFEGRYSEFRRRNHGRPLGSLTLTSLIGYAQNHDQIGNRPVGDRLAQSLSSSRLKLAATLVLLGPFVPMLFMGEEWGATTPFLYFTDHRDPTLAAAVTAGRKREHATVADDVPDPQALTTFHASRLRHDEPRQPPNESLYQYTQALIALRRQSPSLRDGKQSAIRVIADDARQTLEMTRGEFRIICNFSPDFTMSMRLENYRLLLPSSTSVTVVNGYLSLPQESAVVLVRDEERKRSLDFALD